MAGEKKKKRRKQTAFQTGDENGNTFGQKVQKSEVQEGVKKRYHKSQQNTFRQKVQKLESEAVVQNDFSTSTQQVFQQNVRTSGNEEKQEREEDNTGESSAAYRQLQRKTVRKKQIQKTYRQTFRQKVQKSEPETKEPGSFQSENAYTGEQKDVQKKEQQTSGQKVQKSESGMKESRSFQSENAYTGEQKDEEQQAFGQKVQKSGRKMEQDKRENKNENSFTENGGNSFTQDSNAFTEGAEAEFSESSRLKRKRKQAEKAAGKVEKAKKKLPKKREYTLQRVYDEETGKGKYVVVPFEVERPYQPDGIGKQTIQRVQMQGRNFIHGKIAENEKENAAVEGFHKTEQRGEELFSFVRRQYKGKAYRQRKKIAKLEKKQFQKEVNFRYEKFLEENPQMKKKALQKRLQKQRIKREYLKARQKKVATKSAQEAVTKSANLTTAAAKKLQETARNHAAMLVTIGVMAVLLVMIMTSMASCGAMFVGTQSTILAASYLSEPEDIDAADLQFTRLELDLQNEIDNIETDYPDYDEYTYNLGEIGHNPFTLISYLSAVHTEFTAGEVEREVQALFEEMYTLTKTPDTETRTRTVIKTGTTTVTDPETGEEAEVEYEYEDEEEYEVSILRVVLTVKPLESIAAGKMDTEQKEFYALYMETGGLLQQFASPVDLYWYNYISSYYGYRKNTNTGNEELHRGVDIALPTGTTVYAAHDGVVTVAAYDSSYGNYVVLEKDGYTTKYAHMNSLSVTGGQSVKKGDVIGTTGNTGSSTGSHLHIECLYNGTYYNPLFYFDVGEGTLYGETPGGNGGNRPGNVTPPDSYDDAQVQALMAEAEKYLGYPYVWGGSSPSTSFDCSGFVCWVFSNSGVYNLPRTTAQGIYDQCTLVSANEAKPGDIIFFTGTYNSGSAVSHVGIYCGNGVMIHCGDPIAYASITTSYWQSHFYSFGRLSGN